MEVLLSFAQEKEDIILYEMLKDVKEPICWVDVGANDPVVISVTKFFSNMGGYGINIEPQHEMIVKLIEDRPRDINIEAGIGNSRGELVLYGEGTGAGFDANCDITKSGKKRIVPIITLKDVFEEHIKNNTIHFLKIDVEGWEKACLQGMDFCKFRPWIVAIESSDPRTGESSYEEWEYILLENGYFLAGIDGINRFYVSSSQQQRKERFKNVEELDKIYKILRYPEAIGGTRFYQIALKIYTMRIMQPVRFFRNKRKNKIGTKLFGE